MAAYGAAVALGGQAGGNAAPPSWLIDPRIRGTPEGRRAARAPKRYLAETGAYSGNVSAVKLCCKHSIGYSVENYNGVDRAHFNAIINGADMLDSYLPAFQSCFMEGGGGSSMCSCE